LAGNRAAALSAGARAMRYWRMTDAERPLVPRAIPAHQGEGVGVFAKRMLRKALAHRDNQLMLWG